MVRLALISSTLLIATACSSDSKDTPTTAQYDDTAQAVGATAAGGQHSAAFAPTRSNSIDVNGGDAASFSEAVTLSFGTLPLGLSLSGDGSVHGTHLGLEYSYMLTCKLSSGISIACGPTTDQSTVAVTWSGSLSSAYVNAKVSRDGSWSVSGLQSSTATITGDATFSFDAQLDSIFQTGASSTYSFDATANYNSVTVSTDSHLATGGSISYDIHADDKITAASGATTQASFDVQAELTIHADQTASLTLDGDQNYTVDLETGVVARVSAN